MNKSILYILLTAILTALIVIIIGIFQLADALEAVSHSIDALRVKIPE